jgi:hypothetical protein
MFPLWLHGEAQNPEMEHYLGLFTVEYMDDWRHKTIEWEVPIEERIVCECYIAEFVMTIEVDSITFHSGPGTETISSSAASITLYSASLRSSNVH